MVEKSRWNILGSMMRKIFSKKWIFSLKERKEDIPLLIDHFVHILGQQLRKHIQKIDPNIFNHLQKYSFPGNMRELKNMVERALIFCKEDTLSWKDLKPTLSNLFQSKNEETDYPKSLNIKEHEEFLIRKALKQTHNNRHQAAKPLGISWSTLDRKMKQWEIYEHEGN